MNRRFAVLSLSACLASTLGACVQVESPPSAPNEPRNAVVVTGEGEVQGEPDIARLQLGVEAHASDPKVAIETANTQMAAIIQTLKQLGVEAKDLQTSDFSIHSEMFDPRLVDEEMDESIGSMESEVADPRLTNEETETGSPTPEVGAPDRGAPKALPPSLTPAPPRPAPNRRRIVYRVSNMLHVTLRDLSRLGDVLSQSVAAGANQAWGVSFDLDNPAPLAARARAEAIADAKRKATELARVAGVPLGRVISITEQGGSGPVPVAMASRDYGYEAKPVPTESGQLTLRQHVRVVFAIDDDRER